MIRFSKILFVFIIVVQLFWLLPWFYHFTTDTPTHVPFTLYSTVLHDFACLDYDSEKGISYTDRSGNIYTDRQFDSILPLFYFRQLASDGRLPDSLNGVEITPQKIRIGNFMFRLSASEVNVRKAPLYPLLESMSGRVDLKMPDDVCRFTEDGIEFIDMSANAVKQEKSELFTSLMKKKGFEFPLSCIGGNPTTRKDFDNGYFLTDAKHQLFHLKQVCGRPFFRSVALPDSVEIKYIIVREFAARKFHALLVDTSNRLWVLGMPDYTLHLLPVGEYDPRKHDIEIIGDMFNWTVSLSRSDKVEIFALDASDYSFVDSLQYLSHESMAQRLGRYIFPFEIKFTSYNDQYTYPRITDFSVKACCLVALLMIIVLFIVYRKKH